MFDDDDLVRLIRIGAALILIGGVTALAYIAFFLNM
jgi:hypothetical protein